MKYPKVENFYGYSDKSDLGSLYISCINFSFNKFDDIQEINIEELSQYWNTWVLEWIECRDTDGDYISMCGEPQMIISYINDNEYTITFESYGINLNVNKIDYIVSFKSIFQILHKILSAGVLPYTANGIRVKFL